MLLFRPKIQDAESVSSWRQRVAQENGYTVYPVYSEPRRTDPDLLREQTVRTLAGLCDVSESSVWSHSLQPIIDRLPVNSENGRTKWLVPARYTYSKRRHGPVYCPRCLEEDAVPHFRTAWRVAFATDCEKHQVQLHECCPHCAGLVWPHPAAKPHLFRNRWTPIYACAYCQRDLRAAKTLQSEDAVAIGLHAYAVTGDASGVPDIGCASLSAFDYMQGLFVASQLFIRRKTAAKLETLGGHFAVAARKARDSGETQIEFMNCDERRSVLRSAMSLLQNWPNEFLDTVGRAGLLHFELFDTSVATPMWMAQVSDEHLRRQQRGTTVEQVRATVCALKASGVAVTKASVRRALGAPWPGAVDTVLERRSEATREELALFGRLLEVIPTGNLNRRSSLATHCRDRSLAAASVLLQQATDQLLLRRPTEVVDQLNRAEILGDEATGLRCKAIAWMATYMSIAKEIWLDDERSSFRGARKGAGIERGPDGTLRGAIRSIDRQLVPHFSVFAQAVRGPP